jgi:hypothetical protein
LTASKLSPAAISSSRFLRACSTLISDDAMRMVTVRSAAAMPKR